MSYMSILTDPRQGVIYAVAADKTNGVLDGDASRDTLSAARGSRAFLSVPPHPRHLAVVDPGQREGDISRRSDKFAPDYAPVTFIFIEILHSNERPYFSYQTVRSRALDLSLFLLRRLFCPSMERPFVDKRRNKCVDIYIYIYTSTISKWSVIAFGS